MTDLKVMGIIGTRSGSKGIPNKNIKNLVGKPLLGWIIDTAKKSEYINRLVVSTDSKEYADIASFYGAEIPYLRPDYLATDTSPEYDFVKHMIDWLDENENYRPDIVVRMLATMPLQKVQDIDSVIKILLDDKDTDSAVVISEARQHPLKALKLIDDGKGGKSLVSYVTESSLDVTGVARQTYEKAYFRSNVIACHTRVIIDTNSLTGNLVKYHIIPQERAIDIDSNVDFLFAEYLMGFNKD